MPNQYFQVHFDQALINTLIDGHLNEWTNQQSLAFVHYLLKLKKVVALYATDRIAQNERLKLKTSVSDAFELWAQFMLASYINRSSGIDQLECLLGPIFPQLGKFSK